MDQSRLRTECLPVYLNQQVFTAVLLAIVLSSAGCGEEPHGGPRVEVVPVTGNVLVDGQPAEGVAVYFLRSSERGVDFAVPNPSGMTDANGTLSLSTYVSNDGGAPGEYKLLFEWPRSVNPFTGERAGDAFQGKYMVSKDESQFTATIPDDVGGEPHDIGTFELSTKEE